MIAWRRRFFRGRTSNPGKGHLPKARIQVLSMQANDLGFDAKNLRKEIGAGSWPPSSRALRARSDRGRLRRRKGRPEPR